MTVPARNRPQAEDRLRLDPGLSDPNWTIENVESSRNEPKHWHDRAVFHFLTDAADRRKYVDPARRTVPEGGHPIIASFADDGPKRCSDLDVCRYNAASMAAELGEGFSLIKEARETHTTPWNTSQAFFYGVLRRR